MTESIYRRDRRYPPRLPGKTSFTEEIVRSKHCDHGFLALLGNDGDLHLAALDVEDRIRRVSLGYDDLVLAVLPDAAALAKRAIPWPAAMKGLVTKSDRSGGDRRGRLSSRVATT